MRRGRERTDAALPAVFLLTGFSPYYTHCVCVCVCVLGHVGLFLQMNGLKLGFGVEGRK